jgi:regulator of sigma E protease
VTGFFQSVITVVLFVLVLGVLVIIHEIGHFASARLAGVRVLEFGIGFPPRAKVLRNKGETLYTLNWLPIGGFVKLEGEDGADASAPDPNAAAPDSSGTAGVGVAVSATAATDAAMSRSTSISSGFGTSGGVAYGAAATDPHSFASQRWITKMLILVAGVVMNIVLAFAIFTGIAWLASPYVGLTFFDVQPDSPAATAGLQPGESIVAIDGERYQFITGSNALTSLQDRAGETIVLTVADTSGEQRDVTVTLRSPAEIDKQHGALGISGVNKPFEAYFYGTYAQNDLPAAIRIGVEQTVRWMGLIVGGLGQLVSSVVNDPTAPPPVSGPVGIATQIGDIFWNSGPIMLLYVAGILSANLAVVNILPFPPLDGGRMLMITLKRLLGARMTVQAEQLTYMVGFVFLFAFIIWITGFDIVRGLGGGS